MHLFHMTRDEVMRTRYGEMLDLIACHGIFNGAFKEKKKRRWTYEEAVKLK